MQGTFLSPSTCGFGRVVALEVSRKVVVLKEKGESKTRHNARIQQECYRMYKENFSGVIENFDIGFTKFTKKLPTLKDAMNKWNYRKTEEKKKYLKTFSSEMWAKLSPDRKSEHTFISCKSCALRHADIQALFPVKSKFLLGEARKNPVFNTANEAKKLRTRNGRVVKPTQRELSNTAKAMYDEMTSVFEKSFSANFTKVISKVPSLSVQNKSKNDIQSERRDHYRKFKESIEEHMAETAFIRCYGGGESLRGWQRKRLACSFETTESARERSENKSVKPKSHCENFELMCDHTEALKAEVNGYEDGRIVNWSDLARKYEVKNAKGEVSGNGGQIVKEWLTKEGVHVDRFKRQHEHLDESERIRRKKRKGAGGEIAIPVDASPDQLRQMAAEKIRSGEYTIGQRIVPKKYEKIVLTKQMTVKKVEFVIEGRKVPLEEIRAKTLKDQAQYMRDNDDDYYDSLSNQSVINRLKEINEYDKSKHLNSAQLKTKLKHHERQRHLMIWHDNSTVANHGYLVCLVSVLYDPAIFFTNDEYKEKTGKIVDIQTIVEKPQVHFIARCKSSDAEQLAYIETRLSCIRGMTRNLDTANGNQVVDILRFFHGDSPARQFESGQQKGGNYYCSNCGCHAKRAEEIDHALNCPVLSLQDRIDKIMEGGVARVNTLNHKMKPIKDLSRPELERELATRGIYSGETVKELQDLLNFEMKGIQRVPALLVNNPSESLEDLGLQHYEILPAEPLHDVGHHIENVLTELPHHLRPNEKKAMEDTRDMCLGSKESKRGVDYRAALIKTTSFLHLNQLISQKPFLILQTLTEIQRILYSSEEKRNCAQILRYYNQSWYHAILLNELIKNPKKLTLRKMFGVYYHDLTSHAGLMLRLISGQAANAEEDERIFHHIERITKQTTNYNPGHLVPNVFLRLQAEKDIREQDDVTRQQCYISTLSKSLPELTNTRIPISLIKKNSRHWQAHLQNISDFMVEGEGVWWHIDDDVIEFHDISEFPAAQEHGPQLHHFRSSSMKAEEVHLKQCWEQCIQLNITIPIHIIIIDLPDGKVKKLYTNFLGDDLLTDVPELTEEPLQQQNDSHMRLAEDDEEDPEEEEQVLSIMPASDEIVKISDETDLSATTLSAPDEAEGTSSLTTLPKNNTQKKIQKEPDVPETQNDNYILQSNLGIALAAVLGQTEPIEGFDRMHVEFKQAQKRNRRINNNSLQNYQDRLANFQTKVLAENTKAHNCLIEWEKAYIVRNNLQSPSYEEMKNDETAGPLLHKLNYSKALLKQWKINFS